VTGKRFLNYNIGRKGKGKKDNQGVAGQETPRRQRERRSVRGKKKRTMIECKSNSRVILLLFSSASQETLDACRSHGLSHLSSCCFLWYHIKFYASFLVGGV
jgi:hypothetical protein